MKTLWVFNLHQAVGICVFGRNAALQPSAAANGDFQGTKSLERVWAEPSVTPWLTRELARRGVTEGLFPRAMLYQAGNPSRLDPLGVITQPQKSAPEKVTCVEEEPFAAQARSVSPASGARGAVVWGLRRETRPLARGNGGTIDRYPESERLPTPRAIRPPRTMPPLRAAAARKNHPFTMQ